jgi:hypothetical protein
MIGFLKSVDTSFGVGHILGSLSKVLHDAHIGALGIVSVWIQCGSCKRIWQCYMEYYFCFALGLHVWKLQVPTLTKVEFEMSPIFGLITLIYYSRSLGYSWRRLSYSSMHSLVCKTKEGIQRLHPFNTYCIVSHHIKLERSECSYLPLCVELNLLSRNPVKTSTPRTFLCDRTCSQGTYNWCQTLSRSISWAIRL